MVPYVMRKCHGDICHAVLYVIMICHGDMSWSYVMSIYHEGAFDTSQHEVHDIPNDIFS